MLDCRSQGARLQHQHPSGFRKESCRLRDRLSGVEQDPLAGELGQLSRRAAGLSPTRAVKGGRVVFNVKGNEYRVIAAIDYERGAVFIKFVGTHAEYDKVDAETVN